MATFALVLAIGAVALVAYIAFGGHRLPAEVRRVIDEVVSSGPPELVRGRTGHANSGTLRLWYEDLHPDGPHAGTVLLLMSTGAHALMWPRPYLDALLEEGYRVVRFDQRETGLSDRVEDWRRDTAYTVTDLADDAVAILDHLAIDRAHAVGHSLGGMVAQELAIRHPDRVASLVLMSTSPDVTDPSLPSMSTWSLVRSMLQGLPFLRHRIGGGEANRVAERVARTIAAGLRPALDDVRDIAQNELYNARERRVVDRAAAYHHFVAASTAPPRGEKLASLHVPTLVVHGEVDPFFPIQHGQRLAATIPGARGLWLSGVGHVLPYPDVATVLVAIVRHLRHAGDGRPTA